MYARFGKFANRDDYSVTLKIVQEYLTVIFWVSVSYCQVYYALFHSHSTANRVNLPNKKLKVTRENILQVWDDHKPALT